MAIEHERTWIHDIGAHAGKEVTLRGWVQKNRAMKKLVFCVLRDGTGVCQGVINKQEVGDELFGLAAGLNQEAAVELCGIVQADERAPGGYEMQVRTLRVMADSIDYPITPKEHGPEFLLDRRHLWLRSSKQHALLKLRHTIKRAIDNFFHGEGFTQVDAPIFTPNACEGTSTLFSTEYFGQTAYLTQSGQLYMEAAAAAVGKAYCFGPTFRAEKSKTRRHLTEFWMVEPEVAFADLDDVMSLAERFFEYVVGRAVEEHREMLESVLERDISKLEKVTAPFPRLAYDDAVRMLNEELDHPFEWGGDFGSPDETKLASQFDTPFIVHRFPAAIKAFYMARDPQDDRLSLSMDVLAPEGYGEIIGGGERSPDLALLERQIEKHDLPREAFEWYLDLRRYGSFPHGGFGLGVERLVTYVSGINHLRETIPFPRQIHRLYP
ncbi:asparagine--tRNA ligase [bacterium]|nr:MAG: asparagine--tRNA ligase [bacterium]